VRTVEHPKLLDRSRKDRARKNLKPPERSRHGRSIAGRGKRCDESLKDTLRRRHLCGSREETFSVGTGYDTWGR